MGKGLMAAYRIVVCRLSNPSCEIIHASDFLLIHLFMNLNKDIIDHKLPLCFSIILLYMCGFSVSAHGEEAVADSVRKLDGVVVSASKLNREIIPVQQLGGEALQRLGAHNVADAVRYFSGAQIKDYGGIGGLKTVNVRSMGTNHVGVFYDGIQLGNAQNGTVDLGRFSLDNMEAITLYNGQKSSTFQSAKDFGSAASIYLQTRTPVFSNGRTHNFRAAMKLGSFGLANPSFLWEQKLSENLSLSLSAEYLYTTGRYKFRYKVTDSYDTTATRKNGDVNAMRAEVSLFGNVERGYWRSKVYFYKSERGYPGAVVKNKFSHEDRQWDTNLFVQGAYKRDFGRYYSLMFNAKYAYDYLHYLADPRRDESLMYVDNRYRQQEAYLSMANRFTLNRHWDINLSADYQFNLLNADMRDFVFPRRHTGLVALASSLIYDRFRLQGSVLGTFVRETVKSGRASSDRQEWTPTVVASCRPFGNIDLDVRAFYKRIFRMPTLNDLYYTFVGNVKLDPEYTNQYNIGLTYSRNFAGIALLNINAQADVYYNEIENKIVAMPTSNFFRWTMMNLGKVEIRGLDLAFQAGWRFLKNIFVNTRINYTFQLAQDFTDKNDPYYGDQIPYIPRHSGSAVVNLNYFDWEANYSFIYTGERYSSRANIPVNYVLPWYTSDFSVGRTLRGLGPGDLKLTLEVNNIFNQQYEVVACYPMPGINFRAVVQYLF